MFNIFSFLSKDNKTEDVKTPKQLRDDAGSLQKEGRHEEAIRIFRKVYEADPKNFLSVGEYARALCYGESWGELGALAKEVDFVLFEKNRSTWVRYHDLDELEKRIWLEVCLEAAQTIEAVTQLSRAVRYTVDAAIPGDFVECGVYKGASAVCIIRTLQALGVNDRSIWLYDTFEGMPKPAEVDVFRFKLKTDDWSVKTWEQRKRDDGSGGSDWCYSPIDEVKQYVGRTKFPDEQLRYVKGLVEETIPNEQPEKICLLRLDTDFYSSTKHELVHLYPKLSSNGVLIIDDYGAYQGAKKAVDEYFVSIGQPTFLSRVDEHVRLAVKR